MPRSQERRQAVSRGRQVRIGDDVDEAFATGLCGFVGSTKRSTRKTSSSRGDTLGSRVHRIAGTARSTSHWRKPDGTIQRANGTHAGGTFEVLGTSAIPLVPQGNERMATSEGNKAQEGEANVYLNKVRDGTDLHAEQGLEGPPPIDTIEDVSAGNGEDGVTVADRRRAKSPGRQRS